MAWNEPGKSGESNSSGGSRKPDAPPDLDEVLRELQKKLRKLWGSKKPGNIFGQNAGNNSPSRDPETPSSGSSPDAKNPLNISAIMTFIGLVILAVWGFSGFYIVQPSEKAAVLRLGKYVSTEEPGLHWIPSLIDSKYVVNVQQVLTYPYHAEMLTQDENIVSIDLVVQYRIENLRNYLFNVANPTESLQQATASALRQVIGQTPLDDVLTSGREKVREQTTAVLENTLAAYHTGLLITDVNMQPAKPPEEVTAAFDDAIKAREDEQRFKNQATAYANRVVPVAEGNAARLKAEAQAYRQQVVLNAQGATAKFLALLPEYQRAPGVTRERLYMDALQSVYSHSLKVILDTPQGNQMVYLPLDKLVGDTAKKPAAPLETAGMPANNPAAPPALLSASVPDRPGYAGAGYPGYDTAGNSANNAANNIQGGSAS